MKLLYSKKKGSEDVWLNITIDGIYRGTNHFHKSEAFACGGHSFIFTPDAIVVRKLSAE
jgi:hypothetical protein